MFDFDPRDSDDARDGERDGIYDSRWGEDVRDRDERDRDLDSRDRDPRDPFVHGFDLPHGLERELVQDEREHLYELNGEDSRMLATITNGHNDLASHWHLLRYTAMSRSDYLKGSQKGSHESSDSTPVRTKSTTAGCLLATNVRTLKR